MAIVAVLVLALAPASVAQRQPETPVTLGVLRLVPESAMATLALPPLATLNDKAFALATRLSAAGIDGKATLDAWVRQLAQWLGTPTGSTLPDMFRAKGFDPNAPCGVFLDFSPQTAKAQEAVDMITSGCVQLNKARKNDTGTPYSDWLDLDKTNMVVVLGCADPKLAENCVQLLLAALVGPQTPQADANGIQTYGRLAYCIVDGWMFVTNHVPMLMETLARTKTPTPIPYWPARGDEIVFITRLDRLTTLMPAQTPDFSYAIFIEGALAGEVMRAGLCPRGVFAGEDPNITTLNISEERLELISRLNLSTHPRYADYVGEPKPTRLAAFLPEECLAFASIALNDKLKDVIEKRWLPFLDPRQSNGGSFDSVKEVFGFLSNEVAVGISPGAADIPRLFLIAEVSRPDAVKSLVERIAPVTVWEDRGLGVAAQFTQLDLSPVLPMHLALAGNAVVLANDRQACKAMTQRLLSGTKTRLLESQTPPIAPETNVFGLFSLKAEALGVAMPFLKETPGAQWTAGVRDALSRAPAVVREVRAGKTVRGDWQELSIVLYLR